MWWANFIGSSEDDDCSVTISIEVKCYGTDKASARKDAEKRVGLAGITFQGKQVSVECDGLFEECNYRCKICRVTCVDGEIEHSRGCYSVSEAGGGTVSCSVCNNGI